MSCLTFGPHKPKDYFVEVGADRIDDTGFIEKFGENPDIDFLATFETLWDAGGIYVPPTTARIHDIVSDSVQDIGVLVSTGTATGSSDLTLEDTSATFVTDGVVSGDLVIDDTAMTFTYIFSATETVLTLATLFRDPDNITVTDPIAIGNTYRVIQDGGLGSSIFYIDGSDITRAAQREFILLNGTTSIPTVNSYFRQRRARSFGTLSNTGSIGNITSTAQTDGTVSAQILTGNSQTLMAVDMIPTGKVGYITKWWGSLSKKGSASVILNLRTGIIDGVGFLSQTRAISGTGDSEFAYRFPVPVPIGAGTDIWIEASSDTNNTGVSGGFSLIVEDV